eukprot:3667192-Alexandrium_andersonii.AAC.1
MTVFTASCVPEPPKLALKTKGFLPDDKTLLAAAPLRPWLPVRRRLPAPQVVPPQPSHNAR